MSALLNIELDGHIVQTEPDIPVAPMSGQKVFIETYGCQMNVSDTELMLGILKQSGYTSARRPEDADVIVLNTCAIREHAEERIRGRLGQLRRLKYLRPDLIMGVSGCMAKHVSESLMNDAPYVDLVVGPDSYRRLPELIAEARGDSALDVRLDRGEYYMDIDPLREEGSNAWITIMRGCDKFCTFCIVPYVRGRERSVPAREIVRQARAAADAGFREVTLLGQTVNSYRDDTCDFADLLSMIARIDGISRIRFTSPHPSDFSEKFIETMAREKKICRFIHLPVQSGSNRVLKAMKRSYTIEDYLALVDDLRNAMPDLCLSTDIIAGFSGETQTDFEATLTLIAQVRYDSAFMFKYSARKGTVAFREMPDTVSEEEKVQRLETIIAQQSRISEEINATYIGRTLEVLVQGDARKGEGLAVGKSDGFKTVVFPREGIADNALTDVEITQTTLRTLTGRRVQ